MSKFLKTNFARFGKKSLPQTNGRFYHHQLQHPTTINRAKWGIPHIHTQTRHDLFFAQGFVHAQDRLWQMELNRRAAHGTLSQLFGKTTLDTDILSRTMGFGRLAHHSLKTLTPQAIADLTAYTAGVNAFIESTQPRPLEFQLLRHHPEPWQMVDSLAYGRLQTWALSQGSAAELVIANLQQLLGETAVRELLPIYPKENPVTITTQMMHDISTIFNPKPNTFLGKGSHDGAGRGSNGWVIGPQHSATGHALLCNDMHLPVLTPSLWHFQHLRSDDGFHVTGFTLPGLPYVMVGHNPHIAWGITLSFVDCEDYFIEKLRPDDPTRYQFGDEWLPINTITEQIPIRGQSPHIEQIHHTHHGPIVSPNTISQPPNSTLPSPISYSAIALQPDIVSDGFGLLNEAKSWDDFKTAVSRLQAPSLNILYADRHDNIGYYVSGSVPIRAAGNGTQPTLGYTGTHEWISTIPFAEMPHAYNPPQGYIVTANHRIIDDDYPHDLGQMWRSGYRAKRIEQLILAKEPVTVNDCIDIQMDCYCLPGVAIAAHLQHHHAQSEASEISLNLLKAWDGYLHTDSVGGTVYELFLNQLAHTLLSPHIDAATMTQYLGVGEHPTLSPINEFAGYWSATVVRWLATPETQWLPTGNERMKLIDEALAQTTAVLQQKLGTDTDQWQWGKLHQVSFPHALGVQRPFDKLFNQGPVPIAGDADTVLQSGIRADAPYDNNAISVSTRMIIDMGDIANAIGMHTPGQSGHLVSPHYGDLIQPWLNGQFFSMGWQRDSFKEKLTLLPISRLQTKKGN